MFFRMASGQHWPEMSGPCPKAGQLSFFIICPQGSPHALLSVHAEASGAHTQAHSSGFPSHPAFCRESPPLATAQLRLIPLPSAPGNFCGLLRYKLTLIALSNRDRAFQIRTDTIHKGFAWLPKVRDNLRDV